MSNPSGDPAGFYSLSFGAQLLVWATRKRLHLLRHGDDESDVLTAFHKAGLDGARAGLISVVDVLLCGASNAMQLHAVSCPCLAPHEIALVDAIAHLQRDKSAAARQSLEPLLCAAAVRLVMPCLGAVAQALAANGMQVRAAHARALRNADDAARAGAAAASRAIH